MEQEREESERREREAKKAEQREQFALLQANLKELDWSVPNKAEKKGKGKAAKAVVEEADNWLDDDASGVDKGSYEPAMPLLKDDDGGSQDPDFAAAEDIDAKREKKRLKKEAKKLAKKEKKLAM